MCTPQPRPSSVQYHYQALAHSQRQGSYHFTRHPDHVEGVHVGVGVEGRRGCLPSPGEPPCSRLPTQARGRAETTPYILLSCQGTSLQGLPQGPSEGVRMLLRIHGILLQAGASLETELPASVLGSQLNCLQCCCRGFQDVKTQLGAPYHQGTPAQQSRRKTLAETASNFCVTHSLGYCLQEALLVTTSTKLSLFGVLIVPLGLLEYVCLGCSQIFS